MQGHSSLTIEYAGIARDIKTNIRVETPTSLNQPIKSKEITALWDTGATNSGITEDIASLLDLTIINTRSISSVNRSEHKANMYLADWVFVQSEICIRNIQMIGFNSIGGGSQALIGMDIIGCGDFAITCVDNKRTFFTFRMPSLGKKIDFVEQTNKMNRTRQAKQYKSKKFSPRRQKKSNKR